MYKNKLQELCQKNSYPLPEYQTTREGPPHNPRFSSTVTVNSISFTSPEPARTLKVSQDNAAMVAFNHLELQKNQTPGSPFLEDIGSYPQPCWSAVSVSSLSQGSPVLRPEVGSTLPTNEVLQPNSEPVCQTIQISSPVAAVADVVKEQELKSMMHLYKSQLQNYAQKRNLMLPEYAPEREGPPHNIRFRCKVTIDGQTFESPKFYSTLKDAEHAAAEVAFKSLQPSGVQEDGVLVYKNLLQELIQKEGLRLPVYSTTKSGEAHRPTFTSQVEIEGKVYTGQESKTKKQAEMSAAKVAYTTMKEFKAHGGQAPELFPNCSKANVVTGPQQHSTGESSDRSKATVITGLQHHYAGVSFDRSKANVITGLQHHSDGGLPANPGLVTQNPPNKDKVVEKSSSSGNKNDCSKVSFPSKPRAIPTSVSDSNNVDVERNNVSSTSVSTPPGQTRVRVYSRKTNVEIVPGGTLMPCSDDKYVAYTYSE